MKSSTQTQATSTMNPTLLIIITVAFPLLCSLTALLFVMTKRRRVSNDDDDDNVASLPPSPWRLPLIGNLHQLTTLPHRGLHSLSMKLGPLMLLHFGSIPFCVITSGELAREVTNTHDAIFSDRLSTKASRMLFPKGDDILCSPDNNIWRLTRKLCVLELLSPKMVHSLHYIREEEVDGMLQCIRRYVAKASMNVSNNKVDDRFGIDLSSLFVDLASNIVSRAVLGLKSSSSCSTVYDDDDEDVGDEKGKLAMRGAHSLTELFSFGDFVPALAWLDHVTGLNKKLKNTCKDMHAFLDKIIQERHETIIQSKISNNNDRKCFLDILLERQEQGEMIGGMDFTLGNIRSLVMDMFIAGVSSSGATLEWAMAELANNPNVMKKVQNEVRNIIGQNSKIQQHDIEKMEYLKCVIKETLRLHGATMTARKSTKTVIIGGFKIPANVTALISMWAVHRNPSTWDKPLEFLPERFINTSYGFKGQDEMYFPFGLGKRICPGSQFAIAEIEFALANVLCWFDWELPASGMELDMRESRSVDSHKVVPLVLVPVVPATSA